MVESKGQRILIDTSPDLREQLLAADVQHLDGILYTHAHSDHLHGVDDIRGVNRRMNAAIPVYADAATLKSIQDRFGYVFESLAEDAVAYYKPVLAPQVEIHHADTFQVGEIAVTAIDQDHRFLKTKGFRLDDFAYSTDLVSMHKDGFDVLKGIKVWMLGTFSDKPHPTHLDVGQALTWIDRVKPERAYLTHLSFGLDFDTLQSRLPDNVFVAYDGLVVDL